MTADVGAQYIHNRRPIALRIPAQPFERVDATYPYIQLVRPEALDGFRKSIRDLALLRKTVLGLGSP